MEFLMNNAFDSVEQLPGAERLGHDLEHAPLALLPLSYRF